MASFLRRLRLTFAEGPTARPAGGAQCRYVAVIMDGNGRWAARRHLPVAAGHRAGAKALRQIVEHALDCGILELTAYSFSTENWARSPEEVETLLQLFLEQIATEVPEAQRRGARVRFIGRRAGLPQDLREAMERAEAANRDDARMTFYIALNYGSRAELVDATRALLEEQRARRVEPAEVTEDDLRRHFYAPEMHDPELLIRTSGEQRLSNFLLWQLAYAELLFVPKLWPDFTPADLDEALAVYARRQRRFGRR